jgi:signal transduction histidine kinase
VRHEILLSTLRASPRRRHIAFVVAMIVFAAFIAVIPIAQVKLARFPVIIPIVNTITFLNDTLTAILLFGQYAVSRTRALCLLAFGFLFTALMAISHLLSFPEAFSSKGLLGGGPQETAWLYVAWHAVLPLAIIAYSLKQPDRCRPHDWATAPLKPILGTAIAALCSAVAITWIVVAQPDWFFTINDRGLLLPGSKIVVALLLVLPATALFSLFVRSRQSVLDVWLMVMMFTWICTISLVSFVSAERYDAAWYAGRIFQSIASVIILIVFVTEMIGLYARNDRAAAAERRAQQRRISEMEAVLIHLSRVKETSRSALNLIHEIGQPLAAISLLAHASLKMAENQSMARLRESLELLAEQAEGVKAILQDMRGFLKETPERGVYDIRKVINDAIKLTTVGEQTNVAIVEKYDPGAATLFFNRAQIEQVVLNLARNAIEAMADVEQPTLYISTNQTPDGATVVSIADNGPGLTPTVRARLFQPFFTTKQNGLGIGLSISQLIIQAHGGRLQAEDNPGRGAIFYFTLPRSPPDATTQ